MASQRLHDSVETKAASGWAPDDGQMVPVMVLKCRPAIVNKHRSGLGMITLCLLYWLRVAE